MDNLTNKSIKQYSINTDDGEIIISAIIDRTTKMVEWWGHLKGYGIATFLMGGKHLKHRTWQETAYYMADTFYDDIVDTAIDEDITKYMDGYSNKGIHDEIKRVVKFYNEKLAEIKNEAK